MLDAVKRGFKLNCSPKEEVIEAAKKFIETEIDKEAYHLAILSGSHAFGLEHALSDIDVYFVAKDITNVLAIESVNGYTVQSNCVSLEEFFEIETLANPHKFPMHDWRSIKASDSFLKKSIRLTGGYLLDGKSEIIARWNDFDWNHLSRYVLSRGGVLLSRQLEDAAGCLQYGDYGMAWLAVREAVEIAADMILAADRDLYVGRKCLSRRLRRNSKLYLVYAQVLDALDAPEKLKYLEGISYQSNQDFSLKGEVIRHAALASYLGGIALLRGWDVPVGDVPVFKWSSCGWRRNPFFTIQRYGNAIGVAGYDKGYRMGKKLLEEWLELNSDLTKDELMASHPKIPFEYLVKLNLLIDEEFNG